MSRTHPIALMLVVVLAGGLAWRTFFEAEDPLSFYAPDAYVERANRLITEGYLRATCFGRRPQLELDLEKAPASERAWFEESYLAADVARFNADPEGYSWTFQIDRDCRLLGVNPAVHTIDLPFHKRLAWLGSIYYGSGSAASLRSPQREIELQPPTRPVPVGKSVATEVGKDQDIFAEGSVLLTLPGGRARQAASIFYVGDRLVTQNGLQGQDQELRLMGHRLPMGRLARLDSGDWLSLESRERSARREVFVYREFEKRDPASVVRRQNDRNQRQSDDPGLGEVPDPARQEPYPYLDQVAKSISNALGLLPAAEGQKLADGFDVELSIERKTQLDISRTFRERCAQKRKERGLEPFSAGVTVLDGRSGKVLAMATYPTSEELEGLDFTARQKRRLLQNQNLVQHAIGSAGKPFFFAAVANEFPELIDLTIAGHAPERYYPDLFQCRIPLGYHLLEGHGDPQIDFARALEVSCNKYTVELLTLSLAAHWARYQEGRREGGSELERLIPRDPAVAWPKPGQSSGVRIGGTPLTYAPYLAGFIKSERPVDDPTRGSVVRCSTLAELDRAAFASSFEHITGAAIYAGRNPGALPNDPTQGQFQTSFFADAYDLRPWQKLVARLNAGHEQDGIGLQARTALHAIAPERVNLALNQVTRLRGDFISLALGGGTSLWTNLQLAESISRLVGGRAVDAEIAQAVFDRVPDPAAAASPAVPPPLGAPLQIKPKAREAVLEGMWRVVEGERGTARALRGTLNQLRREFPQDTLVIYSKTGSPILDKPVPTATSEALEKLVQKGRLVWSGYLAVRLASGKEAAWADKGKAGRAPYEQAFQQALAEVGYGRAPSVRAALLRAVDRSIDALTRTEGSDDEADDDNDPPLGRDGQGLKLNRDSGLFRNQSVKSLAGIYIFTLLKLPGENAELPPTPEALADPRVRMISVAIHLEAGEGSEDAVDIAKSLLPKLQSLLAAAPAEKPSA